MIRRRRRPRASLRFVEGLLDRMALEAAAAAPRETGWVGLGHHDRVTRLIGPGPRAVRTPTAFLADLDFQRFAIARLRAADPRLEPLVFGHSHASGPPEPSEQDRATAASGCAEIGRPYLDVAICGLERGARRTRAWRYHARKRRFEELALVEEPRRCRPPASPFEDGFAWYRTPYGEERLLIELHELARHGWRYSVDAAGDRVALTMTHPRGLRVELPRSYPFEQPWVEIDGGCCAAPSTWSSARTLADVLSALARDARDGHTYETEAAPVAHAEPDEPADSTGARQAGAPAEGGTIGSSSPQRSPLSSSGRNFAAALDGRRKEDIEPR